MERSKEMGKPVKNLTPEELRREKRRCQLLIRVYKKGPAVKELSKRLYEIEKREARDA
ncbi:MAG TPA: hypothetical protein VNE39_22615 [Planctomycetota bacterium]|nr:hypothetical protein [Planctomycetota bacterium]